MRVSTLLEVQLNRPLTRAFLREIETGTGGMAKIAKKRPEIAEYSQEALKNLARGGEIALYRVVMIPEGENLRPDDKTSLTLSLKAALHIMRQMPGLLMGPDKMTRLDPTILKYKVPLDRILVYVPAIAKLIEDQHGREGRVRTERAGMLDVSTILDAALSEEEVYADVSGIEPAGVNMSNWIYHTAIEFFMKGGRSVDDFIDYARKNRWVFGKDEESKEEARRVLDHVRPLFESVPRGT